MRPLQAIIQSGQVGILDDQNQLFSTAGPINPPGTKSGFSPGCVANRIEPSGSNTIPPRNSSVTHSRSLYSFYLIVKKFHVSAFLTS